MNSDDRFYSFAWICATSMVVAVVFLVSSCVMNDSKISAELKQHCMQQRGEWSRIPDSDRYACKFK